MSIKWSQFGEYDPTIPIGQNEGVGLQSATNVRWPAWYFSSSETITTGASPVNINPEVYHTKVISGGTGGTEVLNFPDVDQNYLGRPHLVTFDTRTNSDDQISIASNTVIVSPFGFTAPEDDSQNTFTSLFLTDEGEGALLTWSETGNAGTGWQIIKLIGFPELTYQGYAQLNFNNDGQSVLIQNGDGTLDVTDDPQNPNFSTTITASSTDQFNPTIIPANVRYVKITSSGLGRETYVTFDIPNGGAGGLRKMIHLETIVNNSDSIVFINNLYNSNFQLFTRFSLNVGYRTFVCEFSNVIGSWIFLGSESTITPNPIFSNTIMPSAVGTIVGAQYPYLEQHSGGEGINGIAIDIGQNYKCFTNSSSVTYALPVAQQLGCVYSFAVTNASTLTINVPNPSAVVYAGNTYNTPTISSSQLGAAISFRDTGTSTPGYTIESMTGTWSFTAVTLTTVPSFVNAAASTTGTTTIAPSLPGSRVNGNLLLAWCRVTGTAPGILAQPAGWTICASINTGGNSVFHTACVAYRFVDGAETVPTFNFTPGGAGTQTLSAQVFQYTGTIAASPIGSICGACYDGAGGTNVTGGPFPMQLHPTWTQFPCSTLVNIAMVNPGVVSAPSTPTSFTSRNTTTQEARISDASLSGGVFGLSVLLSDTGMSNWTEFMLELRSQ